MWTPRRVLLLVAVMAGYVAAYLAYAGALGWIDGLPPLAPEYLVRLNPDDFPPVPVPAEKPVDAKLRLAFGPGCAETAYTIKVDLTSRGLVLAADTYEILADDGRVMLTPFSLAVYQNRGGDVPEVSAVHCDKAFLTFEQPIRQPADMGKYRIVAAEFAGVTDQPGPDPRRGFVFLTNNRRTPDTDDDVVLRTRGPILYHEDGKVDEGVAPADRPHIWTTEPVLLEDRQSKPRPATVSANAMNVYLAPAEPPPATRTAKPPTGKSPAQMRGVKAIELCSNVRMDLWVGSNGFLAGGRKEKDAAPEEKVRLEITTLGPFRYDVPNDRAHFEILPAREANPGLPNQVVVHRHSQNGANDQLFCDALDVQFRRRPATATPAPAGGAAAPAKAGGYDMEVEEAHASGKYVALASDAEDLSAYGSSLHYAAKDKRTVLTGNPWMVASKDGHEIHAPELVLVGIEPPSKPPEPGARPAENAIRAFAPGPGEIIMLDRQTGRQSLRARWKDRLTFDKEEADGKTSDVLTLTGSAVFEDRDHAQNLAADTLKVWIEPEATPAVAPAAPGGGKPPAKPQGGRRPSRLLASGHVVTNAPELRVHDTDRLVVWFRDPAPPKGVVAAAPTPPPAAPPPAAGRGPKPAAGPPAVAANPPPAPAPAPKKDVRPIDVSARSVETFVIREGGKHELDRVVCEGRVRVHQEAADPKARATDIRGQTLVMTRAADGSVLDVTDAPGEPAEVHLDKLSLLGPEIHIDQRENLARVTGAGTMRMLSTSDLNGRKLEKASPVTIHWQREMVFTGKFATFDGNVSAEQETNRLLSSFMTVELDRVVSLNQAERRPGTPGDEPARINKVLCDTRGPNAALVTVEDRTPDPTTGKVVRVQRIVCPELDYRNEDGQVVAPGPGVVSILQPGTKENFGSKPTPKPAGGAKPPADSGAKPETVMKLTRVEYNGRMLGVNTRRYVAFYDDVKVLHVPTEDINVAVNVDDPKKMPEGAMYLTCKRLEVYHNPGDGKENQMMEAREKAWVQTREFYGQADTIKFNEASNQVIFEGTPDRPATIYRLRPEGGNPDTIKGEKIIYFRANNSFEIQKVGRAEFGLD